MIFIVPDKCLRNRKDCKPCAQIESDCKTSFVCCGMVPKKKRVVPQDKFRLCWKNSNVDEMGDYDQRDVIDTISVLSQALSIDANMNAK